jgi:hypothetical protein
VYAQSLIEFGDLTNAVVSAVRDLAFSIQNWLEHATRQEWLIIGAIILVAVTLWIRR